MTAVHSPAWPAGGGTCGELFRNFDWASTSLGPVSAWPAALGVLVDTLLRAPLPMVVLWGREGVLIYNDAYAPIAGLRHPAIFGLPHAQGWPEIADYNQGVLDRVLAGETVTMRELRLVVRRNGADEETFFDADYSPVHGADGRPAGMFVVVTETTARVALARALADKQQETAALNARLQDESTRLRQLFRDAPGFMCVLRGPQHVFELTNAAYLQLVGHREVVGKTVAEALPEVVEQGFVALLDSVYASGQPYLGKQVPARLQSSPDGALQDRVIDFIYQPIADANGAVTGIFVEGSDVTERVHAELAARAKEEEFASLAEAAPLHVWAADPAGSLYWFNARVYESTGAAPGSLTGDNWGGVVHPDDLPGAAAAWGAAIHKNEVYETEFRIWSAPHQAYRWYLVRALPVLAEGRVVRWIGTNTDIDDKKAATEALAQLNATLEERVAERTAQRDRSWRLSKEIMLEAKFDGSILATNPAWFEVLGWSEAELAGMRLFDLVHHDDQASTLAEAARLESGLSTTLFENRYRHKDGSWRWISWAAVPEGERLHAAGRDVTAAKAAAEALIETEATLRQAQKMEAVGQLTGGIAHDFNNLLQGIVGSMELVRKLIQRGRTEETERFIASAMASAHRAAALTHRLLAFSRRQPLDPKPVKVNRLVAAMEDLLRRSVPEKIKMELALSAGLWTTLCDANQVENAILNLVINARDAMPYGGTLVIETSNTYIDADYAARAADIKPGQYVCIAVTDTGAGMSGEVVERAFDPFFTTKPTGQGTGLGLSMVYGFARQSEGYAKIYSELGTGTTVKLYLPRHHGSAAQDAPPEDPPSVPVREDARVVLVVEDEDVVRGLVVQVLQDLGYTTLEAGDGPAGLKILQSSAAVDLLVTDIGLPGLNGRQVADAARITRPALKVLFMTGYAENAAVSNGFLEPDMQMITKPFAMETLARRVTDMIDGAGHGAGSPHA